MGDRRHQAELRARLAELDSGGRTSILAYVVPGGGKSRLPGIVAERFPGYKIGWFVPRLTLRRQAALDMKRVFGIDLRESANEINPTKDARGFVATQQALAENPCLWEAEFRRYPYILIVDEMHHAKEARNGDRNSVFSALETVEPLARVVLNMTGTLETNDASYIRGIDYEETARGDAPIPEASADIFIRYTRETALREEAIVQIEFHHGDGPVRFNDGEEKIYGSLRDVKPADEAKALFTVLSTEHANHLLSVGVDHFRRHGRKLLVVCDKQKRAKKYHTQLARMGFDTALAIEENDKALADIERFKKSANVLVTCSMAYEGLDVPEITHIICLTHIRSVPWIEQMLARAWRATNGKKKCWAFVPDDRRMNRTIARINAEQLSVIPPAGDGPGPVPGEPAPVIALESRVDRIRAAMLDGTVALNETESELLATVQKYGVGPNDPEFVALVRLIDARRATGEVTTVADEETRLRNGIAEACRAEDHRRDVEYGTTQKLLWRMTGESITTMSIPKLRNAAGILARHCA